ncbi:dipeptidase [Roseibium limicola]|nr:dipeptidase [Roseibium limicola]
MPHVPDMPLSAMPVAIFDGHNDTLLQRILRRGTERDQDFFTATQANHIDFPRAQAGGLIGGLFAMFVPSQTKQDFSKPFNPSDPANYARVDQQEALAFTMAMAAEAFRLTRASNGRMKVCRSATEIRQAMHDEVMAISLHIEGAEAIDPDFHALEALHEMGLRSLGPVWSRGNIFAEGVPMRFNSGPDIGNGLSDTGKALIKACNELKILVDLSHLNEKGFWDVASLSDAPLVASHSNAHAICPNARNLTDKQLGAIRESKGLVGVNFHVAFLREDGGYARDTPLDLIVRHTAYLIEALGEDHVGLGSDFDGCLLPADIGDVSGLPNLIDAYRAAGFGTDLINKIAHENWLNVLDKTQK